MIRVWIVYLYAEGVGLDVHLVPAEEAGELIRVVVVPAKYSRILTFHFGGFTDLMKK